MSQEMDGFRMQELFKNEQNSSLNTPVQQRKINLAVLASGGGSNLASIINAINDNVLTNANIALVISDREKS